MTKMKLFEVPNNTKIKIPTLDCVGEFKRMDGMFGIVITDVYGEQFLEANMEVIIDET